jgi:hypothetical protein
MRRLSYPTITPLTTEELARAAPDEGDLAELQKWMTRLLRHEKNLSQDLALVEAAARHFGGNERVSPAEQIEIYREQFWLRHTASLIEDFPGICGILGQDDWQELAVGYLSSFVPVSFSLRDLGQGLPAYVEARPQTPHHALVSDMALLEWAYIEAFDAPDAPTLDESELAKLDDDAWENARIELAPSVQLLRLAHPVADLRRALRAAEDTGDSVAIPGAMETLLVVYRRDLKLWDKQLDPIPFALLEALQDGLSLSLAANRVLERFPDAETRLGEEIGTWFANWGKLGWIGGVTS